MKSIVGIELVTIVPKDKVFRNPFEIWDGRLPSCTMSSIYNNCSPKCMLMNYVGGANVNKPSPKTSLEEKHWHLKDYKKKKTLSTWNSTGALVATLSKMHTNES